LGNNVASEELKDDQSKISQEVLGSVMKRKRTEQKWGAEQPKGREKMTCDAASRPEGAGQGEGVVVDEVSKGGEGWELGEEEANAMESALLEMAKSDTLLDEDRV